MAISHTQAVKPEKPPKGYYFFAGRTIRRITWWKSASLRKLYFYIFILIMTNTANGFDGSMMNGLQTLSYWRDYFNNPQGSILGLFNASMSLGSLIGLFFVPYTVDRFGRKTGITIGCLIMLVAIGLQAGAQNFGMFIAARLLIGFGDNIVLGAAPLLIAEIAHPQDRAVLVTLSAASYHSGAFLASWVTYATLQIQSDWSWRLPSLLQSICSIIILLMMWFIPESPRYLINRGQKEEGLRVLTHYHANDDENDEIVQLEYAEICAALELEREAEASSWLDFLKTKGNRKRIGIITAIAFFSQWAGNGLISYYLYQVMNNIGITSPQTQLGINGGLKTWDLILNITMSFYVDKFGRRMIYLVSTIGTLLAFTVWTIIAARYEIQPVSGLGGAFVFMIFVYAFFYDFKSGLLASYTTEILPYGLRAKGFTWLNFCVTASLFFNQYVNAIALKALAWKYYIFYCVFLVFQVVIIYYFLVETRYTPLEEIAKYFDGESAADVGEIANAEVKEANITAEEVKSA